MRSEVSFLKSGSTSTPVSMSDLPALLYSLPSIIASTSAPRSSPKYMEMIAGGASFAPSRWSLPAEATVIRSRSWYSCTAFTTAARKSWNWRLSSGFLPGSSRFSPVLVPIDQLLCLPEPFTPAKGFSCSRQTRPCFSAVFFMTSMVSSLWSVAILEVEKIGASSCCEGATSLCLVLASTPNFQSSSSRSFMKAATLVLMEPK